MSRLASWLMVGGLVLAGTLAGGAQQGDRRLFPPEELGVLEGPDRDAWQKPDLVMDALRIGEGSVVADLGAGGGWFTVRLARRVGPNGLVYAQDVQSQMLEAIQRRLDREGMRNVRTIRGETADPKLPADSLDAVLMVDTYHEFDDPVALLRKSAAALRPGGRIGIINFSEEGGGPGPDERIPEESVVDQARQAGLRLVGRETFLEFQYFLIFAREVSNEEAPGEEPPSSGRASRGSEVRSSATPAE